MIELAEQGKLPDILIRFGIRRLLKNRLIDEYNNYRNPINKQYYNTLLQDMATSPIALSTDTANEQHYEVPSNFYQSALGKHLKYSSAYWPESAKDLDAAEAAMLELTAIRAQLEDGQNVLELGCGWGSLTLWIAEHYPNSKITAVSNSSSQRQYIIEQAKQKKLNNIEVITADMQNYETTEKFNRIVSVEMFEHMRNYKALLSKINSWLLPDGKLFVHIFCHRTLMYFFNTGEEDDWMAKYFFTDGLMPAVDTLLHFQEHMHLESKWLINGQHYQRTLEAWLEKLDKNKEETLKIFSTVYGANNAKIWLQRWRIFFMACAELFGYKGGHEWLVAHYLFKKN